MSHHWLSLVCVPVLLFSIDPALAGGYTIIDLGPLSGEASYARSINNSGQVVGNASIDHFYRAFLYSNGTTTYFGPSGTDTLAFGINDGVQLVGSSNFRAFLYDNGAMTDLGTLGGTISAARGINNSGQVVGDSYTAMGTYHAFLYSNGAMADLGTLGGGYSQAASINNAGQVVGGAWTIAGNGFRAFLYSNGVMTNLGTLGGTNSYANGINDSGQVVGYTDTGTGSHAFLYSNGAMTDLGTLGGGSSNAYDINNNGQIVGDTNNGAFLYSNGAMTDLNTLLNPGSVWTLSEARSINDLGQIAGNGFIAGQVHAFLMSPTPVPIPAAAWLFGSGLLGLFMIGKRRKQ